MSNYIIPGVESWIMDEINVDLNIGSSGTGNDTEDDIVDTYSEQGDSQDEAASIQAEDTAATVEMRLAFNGYDQLERMRQYLRQGGSYRTLEQLFDMRQYIGSSSYMSGQEAFESISNGAKKVGEFIKDLWKKIITLFQRIIPWFGQNVDTLEKRHSICVEKFGNLSNDLSVGFKVAKPSKERKIIDIDKATSSITSSADFVSDVNNYRGTSVSEKKLDKAERTKVATSMNSNADLKSYIDSIGNLIKKVAEMRKGADDGLKSATEALKKIEDTSSADYTAQKNEVTIAKKRVTSMRVHMNNACAWLRMALDDAFWLIGIASKGDPNKVADKDKTEADANKAGDANSNPADANGKPTSYQRWSRW